MATVHDLIPFGSSNLTRRDDSGFGSLRRLQREMDELFDMFSGGSLQKQGEKTGFFAPMLDISEDDKGYHIEAEMPGVDEKNIDVNIADNVLTIKAEKRGQEKKEGKNYHRIERSFGTFQRSVTLPPEIDEEKVRAQFKNGVLTIEVPKSEQKKEKTRRIEVKSS
jgi:HSP20 family protein